MEYRTLGRTGWRVAEISCGTYRTFDAPGEAGKARVLELMRANVALGINLFDSAPMYGHSEANIGHAAPSLETTPGAGAARRPGAEPPFSAATPVSTLIATKVLQHDLAGARRQIENSFRVIGGRIDLLQIHNMAGWREVLPYLVELKAEGRIGATGITHYNPGAFGEIEAASKTGQADVIQIPYNMMEREVERRLLPLAREKGLGVLVMTPIRPMSRRGEPLELLPPGELAALGK